MRIVMTSLAVLALVACKPAGTANDMNAVAENVAMEANAMEANATATPAAFQLDETTWEYTRKDEANTESIDASGNYVVWSGDKHVDHGTAVMKDDKACFTSLMDKEGEVCWTTQPTEIGDTLNTVSDKDEKLAVKRVAFMPVPDAVKP
jgi:hypothetical protein